MSVYNHKLLHYIYIYIYIYIYVKKNFVVGPKREKINISKWKGPQRDLYFLKKYLFCSYIQVCFQLVAFVREHMWYKAM